MNSTDYSKCSPEEIERLVSTIQDDQQGKELLEKIFAYIQTREQAEAFGRSSSPSQIAHILLTSANMDTLHHEKLSQLIVGMRYEVFRNLLLESKPELIQVLKRESVTEPLQHHLTYFAHLYTNQIEEYTTDIIRLDNEIDLINPEWLKRAELDDLLFRIYNASLATKNSLDETNAFLALAWNTNRGDLVEKFSAIKDVFQKFKAYIIGSPRSEDEKSYGLYAKLETKLLSVYGNQQNQKEIDALQDEEPAIEALTKLSIWYLKDYWEIGLLPSIPKQEQLNLGPHHSEEERAAFREKLMEEAKRNLENSGLHTVKDLKNAFIFSKQTLKEYLAGSPLN